jgi:phosphohistidine phosphatase SixA
MRARVATTYHLRPNTFRRRVVEFPDVRRRLFWLLAAAAILMAARPASAQRAVFVVRHAEKASDSNDPGVPLSQKGRARAKKLAAILERTGVTAIYSTDTVRTLDTAKPLAQALKITVRKYAARDAQGNLDLLPLAKLLKTEHPRDVVLVVGHGNTVPPLLKALGATEPVEIPDDRFDDLFVLVPAGTGPPTLLRLSY